MYIYYRRSRCVKKHLRRCALDNEELRGGGASRDSGTMETTEACLKSSDIRQLMN